jgi:uncharacterized OB-fold protein
MSDDSQTLLPEPTERSEPYWEAANEERFVLQQCADCETYLYYPRAVCTNCFGTDLSWETASGQGSILTYTVVSQSPVAVYEDRTPYVLAIVELADGPQMMSNIINCRPEEVDIGELVTITFERRGDRTLPQFELED